MFKAVHGVQGGVPLGDINPELKSFILSVPEFRDATRFHLVGNGAYPQCDCDIPRMQASASGPVFPAQSFVPEIMDVHHA